MNSTITGTFSGPSASRRACRGRAPVSSRYHSVACFASSALAVPARRVDLVVDVGDVVDERDVVTHHLQPRSPPHADDEGPRVADVSARVHGRAADVHPHRAGRQRQVDQFLRVRVKELHRSSVGFPHAAAPRSLTRVPARSRVRSRRASPRADCHRLPSAREGSTSRRACRASPFARSRNSRKRSSVGPLVRRGDRVGLGRSGPSSA